MIDETTKIWQPSNVFPTASIGKNCKIGAFSEIGNKVIIGSGVDIGAMTFIPEGVIIEDGAWIGPRVTFTNDRFPPSPKTQWEKTLIKKGARLGAGCTIICGVTIGEGSLVGAGSVVTKDIPPGETWAGIPAKKLNGGTDADN